MTHDHSHSHTHVDSSITTSRRGMWAVKWSFVGLMVTAMLQLGVFYFSRSVALLADTIHNFSDAATAIPLGIAFLFARRAPTRRFTFGYGRVEDLAGVAIVCTILGSAIMAGMESFHRFFHPQTVTHPGWVILASLLGFLGNEAVAVLRIRVGKEISSAALVADGYHARADGFTSLAVVAGAVGVWLGFPLADPIVGMLITIAIFRITWNSAKTVFLRLLDGVESGVVEEMEAASRHVDGVRQVYDVRARWIGHRLNAQLTIAVDSDLSISKAHDIATEVHHHLLHHLTYLSTVSIHVDPADQAGEHHHRIDHHT